MIPSEESTAFVIFLKYVDDGVDEEGQRNVVVSVDVVGIRLKNKKKCSNPSRTQKFLVGARSA